MVWLAPGGVDLAIVSAPCVSGAVRTTAWPATRPSIIGDPVFAIGNPQQWGWTQAQGFVSQFRTLAVGGRDIGVIRSSAPINPGNSGGGLYDRDGFLIGVNTWVNASVRIAPEECVSGNAPRPGRDFAVHTARRSSRRPHCDNRQRPIRRRWKPARWTRRSHVDALHAQPSVVCCSSFSFCRFCRINHRPRRSLILPVHFPSSAPRC